LKHPFKPAVHKATASKINRAQFFENKRTADKMWIANARSGQFDILEMTIHIARLVLAPFAGVPVRANRTSLPFAAVEATISKNITFVTEVIHIGIIENTILKNGVFGDRFSQKSGRKINSFDYGMVQ
jgi:hypothetical protein